MSDSPTSEDLKRRRQKITLIVLSLALILGGIVVLVALRRLPLPMRLVVGLGDFVAAAMLLTFLRQNYSGK